MDFLCLDSVDTETARKSRHASTALTKFCDIDIPFEWTSGITGMTSFRNVTAGPNYRQLLHCMRRFIYAYYSVTVCCVNKNIIFIPIGMHATLEKLSSDIAGLGTCCLMCHEATPKRKGQPFCRKCRRFIALADSPYLNKRP